MFYIFWPFTFSGKVIKIYEVYLLNCIGNWWSPPGLSMWRWWVIVDEGDVVTRAGRDVSATVKPPGPRTEALCLVPWPPILPSPRGRERQIVCPFLCRVLKSLPGSRVLSFSLRTCFWKSQCRSMPGEFTCVTSDTTHRTNLGRFQMPSKSHVVCSCPWLSRCQIYCEGTEFWK